MNALLWLTLAAMAGDGAYRVEPATPSEGHLLEGNDDDWMSAGSLSFGPVGYRTRFRALWDDQGLYLRFDVEDPAPWHTMTKRDDPLWDEEVVEIFLDLDGSGTHYAEVELSPANVLCDVRMIRGSPDKQMDLAFTIVGLSSRVLPRPKGLTGWTGILFVPWDGLGGLPSARGISLPPRPGDQWRFNVYRIERPHGPENPTEGAIFASWSPTGSDSFHVPASFQIFQFAK